MLKGYECLLHSFFLSLCCEGECYARRTPASCDMSDRGDESPEGSTGNPADPRAASHNPHSGSTQSDNLCS